MLNYISENIKKYISNLILITSYMKMCVKEEEDYKQLNEWHQIFFRKNRKAFTIYHLVKRFSGIMPSLLETFISFRPMKMKSERLTEFQGKSISRDKGSFLLHVL